MDLPHFRYHPDPVGTGAVVSRPGTCPCCNQQREYVYVGSVYGPAELREKICPWCIAEGSVAQKFGVMFSDDEPLLSAGVPAEIATEVATRTLGYNSWQQEVWQAHCGDACAFHGDASKDELRSVRGERLAGLLALNQIREGDWTRVLDGYVPGGNPAVYKFVCLHCGVSLYPLDFT